MIFRSVIYRLSKTKLFYIMTFLVSALFMMAIFLVANIKDSSSSNYICKIGVVDNDDTYASRYIITTLSKNYSVVVSTEEEINTKLLEQFIDVAITIPSGFYLSLDSLETKEVKITSFNVSSYLPLVQTSINDICKPLRILALNIDEEGFIKRLEAYEEENSFIIEQLEKKYDYSLIIQIFAIISFLSLYLGTLLTKPYFDDKINNMKYRIKLLPVNEFIYTLESVLAYFIPLLTISFCSSLALYLFTDVGLKVFILIFCSSVLFNLISVFIALSIYSFCKNYSAVMSVYSILTTLLGMLGGAFWPVSFLPKGLLVFSKINPVYYYVLSLNVINNEFSNYLNNIISMLVILIVIILIPFIKKISIKKYLKKTN